LGIPPLFGFWGKLFLFAAGIAAGQISLVIVAAVSSAISAWYYLKLIGLSLLASPKNHGEPTKVTLRWPLAVAVVGACIAIAGPIVLDRMMTDAKDAITLPETELTMPLPSLEVDGETV
jgi:NADH:ubiquinone oxidoreductase subunit 2 (subunit N)